ncbi:hypothetical protein BDZ85DRAFT_254529 [Elsinoe ampelina]|uniref:Uncharacterized protein n=1 Tax=Elsinoe ampelina TaxID=302913 RepID=A0A6A6GPA7_9PEZI|nr:hypothetical protein BDZ85DRAFT_254529 [Elsinoe ampelina]
MYCILGSPIPKRPAEDQPESAPGKQAGTLPRDADVNQPASKFHCGNPAQLGSCTRPINNNRLADPTPVQQAARSWWRLIKNPKSQRAQYLARAKAELNLPDPSHPLHPSHPCLTSSPSKIHVSLPPRPLCDEVLHACLEKVGPSRDCRHVSGAL